MSGLREWPCDTFGIICCDLAKNGDKQGMVFYTYGVDTCQSLSGTSDQPSYNNGK